MNTMTARVSALLMLGANLLFSQATARGTFGDYLSESLQFIQAGHYPEAIAAAREALRLKPDSEAAYNNIAVADALLHNLDEAFRNIHEALRINPEYQLAKNNLEWFQRDQEQTPGYYMELSLWQYRGGRYQLSIDAAREALKLRPNMAEAYNNIAAAYEALQMYDPAIENARKALELKPDFDLALNNLNSALRKRR